MDKKIAIHTMELWLADLPVVPGHVQHGTRPVVIVSNDSANNFSPIVTVDPLPIYPADACLPARLRPFGYQHCEVRACHGVGPVAPHSSFGRGL